MDNHVKLPGFNLPLNDMPTDVMTGDSRNRFPTAVIDWAPVPVTQREREMLALMDTITDKHEWRRKVFDEAIVNKWRDESKALDDFSEDMFDYVSLPYSKFQVCLP